MILIGSIWYDSQLLPFFLAHYTRLGVSRFVFAITEDELPQAKRYVDEYSQHCEIVWRPFSPRGFNGEVDSELHNELRYEFVPQIGWYIVADLDEFQYYPGYRTVQEVVDVAMGECATAVNGTLIDRISRDGKLPLAVDFSRSLGIQFPMAADITKSIAKGCTEKVLLARSDISVQPGHHFSIGQISHCRGEVHHFKWRIQGVNEQIRRAEDYKTQRLEYGGESANIVELLLANEKAIPLTDFRLNIRVVENDPFENLLPFQSTRGAGSSGANPPNSLNQREN